MTGLWSLAWQSAWSRRYGLSWVVLSIALATFLMLVLVQLQQQNKMASVVSSLNFII
jgi:hypothetical protein